MATVATRGTGTVVLHRVPYKTYVQLRDEPANDHLRMTYHDGTLEIMAPEFRHETASGRVDMLIRSLMAVHGIRGRCAADLGRRAGPVRVRLSTQMGEAGRLRRILSLLPRLLSEPLSRSWRQWLEHRLPRRRQ